MMGIQRSEDRIAKKLTVYSAAAGIVLALSPKAESAIHAHHASAPLMVDMENQIAIDLDGDGKTDFLVDGSYDAWDGHYLSWWVEIKASNPLNYFDGDEDFARRLGTGDQVNATRRRPVVWLMNADAFCYNGCIEHWGRGEFNNGVDGYIGVRFRGGDAKDYNGWIHFVGGEIIPPSGTIDAWAYEDSGGPIKAGDEVGGIGSPPIISDIPNQTVHQDEQTEAIPFTLSDPDTPIDSLTLTAASSNTELVPDTSITIGGTGEDRTITVAPAANTKGTATITLKVSDGEWYSTSSFLLTVFNPIDDAPLADAGPNQMVLPGATVTLSGENSSDPNGPRGTLTYKWKQVSGQGVTLKGKKAAIRTFAAPKVPQDGASLVFDLNVTDPTGLNSTDRCIINIKSKNAPPVAQAGPDRKVAGKTKVTLDGSGSRDPERKPISYLWTQADGPTVALSNKAAVKPTFTAPAPGETGKSLSFNLTVRDSGGLKSDDLVIVNVVNSSQKPPIAEAGKDQTAMHKRYVTLRGSGSTDPNTSIASYLWTQVSGPPVTLSNPKSSDPSFTAPKVPAAGAELVFRLIVTDSRGLRSQDSCKVRVQ